MTGASEKVMAMQAGLLMVATAQKAYSNTQKAMKHSFRFERAKNSLPMKDAVVLSPYAKAKPVRK